MDKTNINALVQSIEASWSCAHWLFEETIFSSLTTNNNKKERVDSSDAKILRKRLVFPLVIPTLDSEGQQLFLKNDLFVL